MHPEKYSLTWHNYSDHLSSMMKELMMNEEFSDVTLVTEDKQQIKANINILSACSPLFNEVLKKDKNSTPIVYLRGIQYSELESIMQFIYLGEATFYVKRMDEVLAVAKSLEIKELCNARPETKDEPDDYPSSDHRSSSDSGEEQTVQFVNINNHAPQERHKVTGSFDCDQCHKTYSGIGELKRHYRSAHQGVRYACDQCDYQTAYQAGLHYHIQSKHEGDACDQCEYQAKRQDILTAHINNKHDGIRYACDQCDHKLSTQGGLTVHIKSKHEGVKYACDQCDHQVTQLSNLKVHIKSKHEGARYACDQCDYQATQQIHLTVHIKSKHNGVRYACDQCNYQGKTQISLTKHFQIKH